MFTLLQLKESARGEEMLAQHGADAAGAQLDLAKARKDEQSAAATLARSQAELGVRQANLANAQNAAGGISLLAAGISALSRGNYGEAVVPLIGAAGATVAQGFAVGVANTAKEVKRNQGKLNRRAATTARIEVDAAKTAVTNANLYLKFLAEDRQLGFDGYSYLLALARETSDLYLDYAVRLSWLTQRAVANRSRKAFSIVKTWYDTEDELQQMMRAQRLTADLEALRAEYTSGTTERRQELKWTVPLSQLAPGALQQLREDGETTFVLSQGAARHAVPRDVPALSAGSASPIPGHAAARRSPRDHRDLRLLPGARAQQPALHLRRRVRAPRRRLDQAGPRHCGDGV